MINIETAKTILVPTDFTHIGEAALKHANLFAAKTGKSRYIKRMDTHRVLRTIRRLFLHKTYH